MVEAARAPDLHDRLLHLQLKALRRRGLGLRRVVFVERRDDALRSRRGPEILDQAIAMHAEGEVPALGAGRDDLEELRVGLHPDLLHLRGMKRDHHVDVVGLVAR
jgi:hypothetical protein